MSAPNEYRMGQSPSDCISALKFSPDPDTRQLLVSRSVNSSLCYFAALNLFVNFSWDSSVRLFNVTSSASNTQQASYSHAGPVLCCAFVVGCYLSISTHGCSVQMYKLKWVVYFITVLLLRNWCIMF